MKKILHNNCIRRTEIVRIASYLIAGAWNTLFGILIYALLYKLWGETINYLILLVPANILAITNAYICYKLFVFKTKGRILTEYLRFYVVYGTTMLLGFIVMFGLVDGLGFHPIFSQCICVGITTVCSYFSHRNFSFGRKKETPMG